MYRLLIGDGDDGQKTRHRDADRERPLRGRPCRPGPEHEEYLLGGVAVEEMASEEKTERASHLDSL